MLGLMVGFAGSRYLILSGFEGLNTWSRDGAPQADEWIWICAAVAAITLWVWGV